MEIALTDLKKATAQITASCQKNATVSLDLDDVLWLEGGGLRIAVPGLRAAGDGGSALVKLEGLHKLAQKLGGPPAQVRIEGGRLFLRQGNYTVEFAAGREENLRRCAAYVPAPASTVDEKVTHVMAHLLGKHLPLALAQASPAKSKDECGGVWLYAVSGERLRVAATDGYQAYVADVPHHTGAADFSVFVHRAAAVALARSFAPSELVTLHVVGDVLTAVSRDSRASWPVTHPTRPAFTVVLAGGASLVGGWSVDADALRHAMKACSADRVRLERNWDALRVSWHSTAAYGVEIGGDLDCAFLGDPPKASVAPKRLVRLLHKMTGTVTFRVGPNSIAVDHASGAVGLLATMRD